MRNRTTIVITHNLLTVRHATTVLVFEEGCVIERGTHSELLVRDGTYAALYRRHHPDEVPPSGLSLVAR